MIPLPALAPVVSSLCLLHACALVRPLPEGPTPVWVRSHNESEVDVYLMCGSIDAQHLGTIEEKGSDAFEIPHERLICAMGLTGAGARGRAAHRPDPPNPAAEDDGWVKPPPRERGPCAGRKWSGA